MPVIDPLAARAAPFTEPSSVDEQPGSPALGRARRTERRRPSSGEPRL
jgi:hypothetical protein